MPGGRERHVFFVAQDPLYLSLRIVIWHIASADDDVDELDPFKSWWAHDTRHDCTKFCPQIFINEEALEASSTHLRRPDPFGFLVRLILSWLVSISTTISRAKQGNKQTKKLTTTTSCNGWWINKMRYSRHTLSTSQTLAQRPGRLGSCSEAQEGGRISDLTPIVRPDWLLMQDQKHVMMHQQDLCHEKRRNDAQWIWTETESTTENQSSYYSGLSIFTKCFNQLCAKRFPTFHHKKLFDQHDQRRLLSYLNFVSYLSIGGWMHFRNELIYA